MCAEAGAKPSCSSVKNILHLFPLPLERFLLQSALPILPSSSLGKNLVHFLSDVTFSHCSLRSPAVFCSLLQHLYCKIMFYFHLCEQTSVVVLITLTSVSQLLLSLVWKGESQGVGFQLETQPGHPHQLGRWPWAAGSVPRQQLRLWSRSRAGGQPTAYFLSSWASQPKALLHPTIRRHPTEPQQRCQIFFCQEFGTVRLKSKGFPASQCINKTYL